jgi:hypothetical protein
MSGNSGYLTKGPSDPQSVNMRSHVETYIGVYVESAYVK